MHCDMGYDRAWVAVGEYDCQRVCEVFTKGYVGASHALRHELIYYRAWDKVGWGKKRSCEARHRGTPHTSRTHVIWYEK